jgi:branched-chain amino acid transport system permease protein
VIDLLLQSLANALPLGALFGLMGLSFGLIYSTSKILHFAHGAVYVGAAYAFYLFYVPLDLPLAMAALASMLIGALLGVAMMRILYEPLLRRGTSGAVMMISSLGLFILAENALVLIFGNESRVVSKANVQQGIALGSVYVTPLQLTTVAVAAGVYLSTFLLITQTKLGRGLRGIADAADVAVIVGVDVRTLRYVVFALGSAVLAVAAILNSLDIGLSPSMGLSVLLIASVAAIIGGASGMFAGIAGGFLIGVVQAAGVIWIDPRWQNLLIFSALIIVLLVRPAGLFRGRT